MHVLVTRTTVDGRSFSSVMRLVARNALGVSIAEGSRAGDPRFGRSMARCTRIARISRRRVLARVARRAAFHGVLALRRVKRAHILMARSTRRRFRAFLFMRGVARQAISWPMYFNRCQRSLLLVMTTQTVLGQERRLAPSEVAIYIMSVSHRLSEGVTTQAVSHHALPILLLGLGARMAQLRLFFMAACAPLRSHLPNFTLREIVAGRAREFFLQDMDSVA